MKGAYGLLLAAFLGVLAVVLNAVYLINKAQEFPSETFLMVKQGVTIEPGKEFTRADLEPVRIPAGQHTDRLKAVAFLWEDLPTVVGFPAQRRYEGGDLLYRVDMRTPRQQLSLGENKGLVFLSLSNLEFEPGLVDPGDELTFAVTRRDRSATSLQGAPPEVPRDPLETGGTEYLGPFRVASLGERIASKDVASAYGQRRGQERSIGLAVPMVREKPDEKVLRLIQLVGSGNYHIAVIVKKAT